MGCAGCAAAGVLGAAVFRKRTEAPAALPLERPLKLAVMADIHSVHGQWSAVYCGGHSAPPGKAAVRFSGGGQQLSRTMS